MFSYKFLFCTHLIVKLILNVIVFMMQFGFSTFNCCVFHPFITVDFVNRQKLDNLQCTTFKYGTSVRL